MAIQERIIKEGKANFQKTKMNAIGGTLTLTNTRLIFQAHGLNFGGKTKIDLNLNQLVRVQSGTTHLISGNIEIFDRYNNTYTFVVYDRKSWAQIIEEAIIKNRENDIATEGGVSLVSAAKKSLSEPTSTINVKSDATILMELKTLKDQGIITESEYEEKRKEILSRM